MTADRPKPYTFFIRGLQMTTVVERMFHVESAAERSTWLEAIEGVKRRLEEVKEPGGAGGIAGMDEEMREQDDDPFETIFAKRGEVQKKSGSKKVVSFQFSAYDAIFLFFLCFKNMNRFEALYK